MTPLLFLVLSLAGGMGAALRFLLDGVIRARFTSSLPLGTLVINVSGSFVLGLITALATSGVVDPMLQAVIGIGLLGGYTTFSTASVETVRLAQSGRVGAAFVNGVGMLMLAVAAALAGLWVGSL